MPIKEGIQYGINDALTNLRSKPINTTSDLPLAARINLLKDKDPKRYQENMQRLIQAEKDGNEEARKLLGEIGEDAGRSRRGYEGLNEFMNAVPFGVSGITGLLGAKSGENIGWKIGGPKGATWGSIIGGLSLGLIGSAHSIGLSRTNVSDDAFNNFLIRNNIKIDNKSVLDKVDKQKLLEQLKSIKQSSGTIKGASLKFDKNKIFFTDHHISDDINNVVKNPQSRLFVGKGVREPVISSPNISIDEMLARGYEVDPKQIMIGNQSLDEIRQIRWANKISHELDDLKHNLFIQDAGKELSQQFKHPVIKDLVQKNPHYYLPLKKFIDEGLNEVDAYKQLIIDRNTVFRSFGIGGDNELQALNNIDQMEDSFARALHKSVNPGIRPHGDIPRNFDNSAELYASSRLPDPYGTPGFYFKSKHDYSQFPVEDLPNTWIMRTVKLQPDFDFSGDISTWWGKNKPIKRVAKNTPETEISVASIRSKILPDNDEINKLLSKYEIDKTADGNIGIDTSVRNDLDSGGMLNTLGRELVFEGTEGAVLPLKVTDRWDNILNNIVKNLSGKGMKVGYRFANDAYNKPVWNVPLRMKSSVPYGYRQGGKINKLK